MSISYIVSALVACGFTCIVGAYGMRVYFVRNREIADREDPRDTQIRDLQATLQVTRKDVLEKKTNADDSIKHLEFAHDRIKELLQIGKETTDKFDACKELLRTKIAEREQLHDKFVAAEREANGLKERLEDAELELSMANESGDMLESAAGGVTPAAPKGAAAVPDSERTAYEEKIAAAQTELDAIGGKLSSAEATVSDLKRELQEAQSNQTSSGEIDPAAAAETTALSVDERKDFEDKLSTTQDRVFVAEGKLSALQKESEEKLAAAHARLTAVEAENREKLAAAQERVSAAQASLAEAREKAGVAESKLVSVQEQATAAESQLATAQENTSAAEAKFAAAQDRVSATEGRLSTVQERILAAEGKLAAAEKEAEERLAAAQKKLISVEEVAEERIADARNKFLAAEKVAQDALAAAGKVAEDRVATAREKLSAAESDAEKRLTAAQNEVTALRNRLQDVEQQLKEAEESERISAQEPEQNADEPDSGDNDDGKMYTSSVDDGSPSLIQCLNVELERWKRHCHVLGDELKQQREQLAAELEEQEALNELEEQAVNETASEVAPADASAADDRIAEPRAEEDPEDGSLTPSTDEGQEPHSGSEPDEAYVAAHNDSAVSPENVGSNGENAADELTEIRGIGKVIAGKLHELGIYRYQQLAALDDEDVDRVQNLIPDFERRMRRDHWMEQARTLHSSKYSEQI
jgi:predicted flap endonuclease-1-like 5' DNA nuclease/predicted  nucleic acid-binding Zn-ribbon protein